MKQLALALCLLAPAACLDADADKGDESALPDDGSADSFRSPTYHGEIGFDAPVQATLSAAAGYHAWIFELSGQAALQLSTAPQTANGRKVDTVLYLYRETATGWGSYIARNDDAGGTVWSRLTRNLGAGRYRVLVKGYSGSTYGKFAVRATCAGEGCAPAAPACLLGATYQAWRDAATIWGERRLTSTAELTPIERDQLVFAAHQSSHDDVTTAEQALARFDGGEVNIVDGNIAGINVVAVEYGAGDNSYGAIFYANTVELAAAIQDGDLYECTALPPAGGAAIGEDCRADSDCPAAARCQGITAPFGVCAANVDLATEGTACDHDDDCGAGGACFGETRGSGLCGEAWMAGDFDVTTSAALPARGEYVDFVTAYGLATVDTDVTLRLQLTHADRSQLKIYVRNPAGTEALAFDGATFGGGPSLTWDQPVFGFSGDESINGSWRLRVVDATDGGGGTLVRWGLTLGSRWD